MIEPLERRLAFADVSVVAAGGGIVVTGSDSDDEILLERRGDQVALVAGTDTTVNGSAEVLLGLDQATGGVTFRMQAGQDSVRVTGQMPTVPVAVRGDAGDDGLVVLNARLRALDLYTGGGADSVNVEMVNIRGAIRVLGGADGTIGAFLFNVGGSRDVEINSGGQTVDVRLWALDVADVRINTGAKQDFVEFMSCSANKVHVNLSGGNDRLDVRGLGCRSMDIFAESGNDEVNLIAANLSHRLRVSMGGGRDLLRVDTSTILRGMDYTDNGAGRFYLSGTRLAGTPSVFASNARATVVATNCRFSEVQLALRGEGSTARFLSTPIDELTLLSGNASTIERTALT